MKVHVQAPGRRDTGAVASRGPWFNRAIAAVLLVLVTVVGVMAIQSIMASEDAQPSIIDLDDEQVNGPERPYPGSKVQITDAVYPLTIGCLQAVGNDDVFVVSITNDGEIASDYLVVAELFAGDGTAVEAMATINDLRAGESRETVLVPDDQLDEIADCTIKAVQSDRRVLLSR